MFLEILFWRPHINGVVLHLLQGELRENGETNTGWVIVCSNKEELCAFSPREHALLNVTAAPQTTPRLRSADNERINMYIPSQVNARQHSNFTAQSRVEAPCTGTSKTVSPLDNERKYKSELLSGRMSDRQDDESQEGNREVGRDKNTRVNSAESDQRRGLLY